MLIRSSLFASGNGVNCGLSVFAEQRIDATREGSNCRSTDADS